MYTIIHPKSEDLLANGTTKLIQINKEVTVKSLMNYGFTNHHEPTLYYMRMLDDSVSFSISVDKETLTISSIDVLNEDFLQPLDYQSNLFKDNQHKYSRFVFDKVDEIMSKFQQDGIIYGYQRGMYI